ncbi:hypothetical protein NMY22_g4210 [Coprinellus aureogranulatus]|nr:hypothetical protein NMY22_g4210 [Coprinellus aureogranulatus]
MATLCPGNDDWVDEARSLSSGQHPNKTNGSSLTCASPRPNIYVILRRKRKIAGPTGSRRTTHGIRNPMSSLPIPSLATRSATSQATKGGRKLSTPKSDLQVSLPAMSTNTLNHYLLVGVYSTAKYILTIFRRTMTILGFPLAGITSLLLLLVIVALLLQLAVASLTPALDRLSSVLATTLGPFCYIPYVSSIGICNSLLDHLSESPSTKIKRTVRWADYPRLVEIQSKSFGQMVDEYVLTATTPSSLSLDLKKAEMATADLILLIRASDLKTRESLASTLSQFSGSARTAGRALARLDAKMNGALDNVMAMNEYTLQAIEVARARSGGSLAEALLPWSSRKSAEVVVKETFFNAMNVLSENLERIILEVEINSQNLDNLEENLNTVQSIAAREDAALAADRDELLSRLWTRLGGNRKDLKNYNRNLNLLLDLRTYRKAAQARLGATMHLLQGLGQEMEDMRERVAAPNLIGSKVTPEVHMMSIRGGLERLMEGRMRAGALKNAIGRKALDAPPSGPFFRG